jgi:hypothetical protein
LKAVQAVQKVEAISESTVVQLIFLYRVKRVGLPHGDGDEKLF